jgi:hypothetical protein
MRRLALVRVLLVCIAAGLLAAPLSGCGGRGSDNADSAGGSADTHEGD